MEVVFEDPIKLRGTTGHIDYSFRIGGVRKFIVETKKPAAGDTAGTARIEYFTYRELPETWDHLVDIFSKERILQGSFDRFVASTKGKGTVSVDRDFLALIESWREQLARNLALRNPVRQYGRYGRYGRSCPRRGEVPREAA